MQKTFVVALYDYDGSEAFSLKFKKGDSIQVLAKLDSGWWDGICFEKRGWFPSNFVSEEIENQDSELPNSNPVVNISSNPQNSPSSTSVTKLMDTNEMELEQQQEQSPQIMSSYTVNKLQKERPLISEKKVNDNKKELCLNTQVGHPNNELRIVTNQVHSAQTLKSPVEFTPIEVIYSKQSNFNQRKAIFLVYG